MQKELESWKDQGDYFDYKGYPIFYGKKGEGPVLLLIHGFPTAGWDWHLVFDRLCQEFTVIVPDMIGFGFSAKPKKYTYSIMDQADLFEALIDEHRITEAHLLCHDYGDTVGQELIARYNKREINQESGLVIRSNCMLNGGLFLDSYKPRLIQKLLMSKVGFLLTPFLTKQKLKSNFEAIFGKNTQPTSQEIDQFYDLIENNGGKYIMHKLIQYMHERKMHRERWTKALQETNVPLRLINGSSDPISGKHMADIYEQLIANPDLIHLPLIGHYPQTEAPKVVLKHYLSFREDQ